mmetsp:Transcript_16051/g.24427  ORF Transcript_16051/g.24427 Transcript_16051/m.24427 type:complete len:317 (-) Transcript_16051:162-1112(-)
MEAECNFVAAGEKQKGEMMLPMLAKMKDCFNHVNSQVQKFDIALERHFQRLGSSSNATILSDHFLDCGTCRGKMQLKQLTYQTNRPRRKLLYCPSCCEGYPLPRGTIEPMLSPEHPQHPFRCPICQFQVLRIQAGEGYRGKGYHVCPRCYSNPPAQHGGSDFGQFQCFSCTNSVCSLAGGAKGGDLIVYHCPFCRETGTGGKITLRKNSRGFVLSCSNFSTTNRLPRCQYTVWLPKAASSVSVVGQGSEENDQSICCTCSVNGEVVRKLEFVWKAMSAPAHLGRSSVACILCDEGLRQDMAIALPQPNQVRARRTR